MTDESKPHDGSTKSVPSQIDISGNGSGNKSSLTYKKSSSGNNSSTQTNQSGQNERVDKAFKNDSHDLGVMYQRYFDCSSPYDQVRFSDTQERLSLYVGEHYQPFGKQFKTCIMDPSMRPAVTKVEMPQMADPTDANATIEKKESDLTYLEKLQLKEKISAQIKQEQQLASMQDKLYNFIYSRCTELLQERVKTHKRFEVVNVASNPFELLTIIREIAHKVESNAYLPLSIDDQIEALYKIRQGNRSVSQYHTHFRSMISALRTQGGEIGTHSGVHAMTAETMVQAQKIPTAVTTNLTPEQRAVVVSASKDAYLAIRFLKGADPGRFGDLLVDLKNNYAKGTNQFPMTVQGAVDLLHKWEENHSRPGKSNKPNPNPRKNQNGPGPDKTKTTTMMVTKGKGGDTQKDDESGAGTKDTDASTISTKTNKSNRTGKLHITLGTNETGDEGGNELHSFFFAQLSLHKHDSVIPKSWLLLDSQSTLNIIREERLLRNIRKSNTTMHVHTNGGVTSTDRVGDLPGYGTVWYDPDCIANVISLADAKDRGFKITYDSDIDMFVTIERITTLIKRVAMVRM